MEILSNLDLMQKNGTDFKLAKILKKVKGNKSVKTEVRSNDKFSRRSRSVIDYTFRSRDISQNRHSGAHSWERGADLFNTGNNWKE